MIGEWVLAGTAIVSAIVAIAAVVRDRRKPILDDVTAEKYRREIKKMSDETNIYRDTRIWQLEGYIDLDRHWHRTVIVQFEQVIDLLQQLNERGLIPAEMKLGIIDIGLPEPPSVPEPPPRG